MLKVLENYCLNTNLNGFVYIAQPSRQRVERIFWSLVIFISFILTGFLIKKLLQESQKNPIVIYTDQNIVHVENINFPAVSVCPGLILATPSRTVLFYRELLPTIAGRNYTIRAEDKLVLKYLQIASLITRDNFVQNHFDTTPIATNDFVDRMHDFEPFFYTAFDPTRNKTLSFFDALWLRSFLANFTQTLWKHGWCYTFNSPKVTDMFHMERMSKDFDYRVFTPGLGSLDFPPINASIPLKSPLPGDGLAVRYNKECLHIKASADSSYLFRKVDRVYYFTITDRSAPETLKSGHRFIFHDSFEVVPINAKSFYSNSDAITKILITPKIRRVDSSLMSESPEIRSCYLAGEKQLKFLKVYNKVNCEHECLTQMTLDACKCVQFFMVRDERTRICGARDESCYRSIEDTFQNTKFVCKCYDNCNIIRYDTRVGFLKTSERHYFDFFRKVEAKVLIEMSSHVFLSVNKRQSSTLIDMLSMSGGFLGLFAGFSFLSAVEIVYYFFIAPVIEFYANRSTRVHPIEMEVRPAANGKVVKYFKELMKESSVHSFNHIGNGEKNILERLIWMVLFVLSMVCAYFMVIAVYQKSTRSAVSITMEGTTTNVHKIPFPAITIQGNSYDYSRTFDISRYIRLFVSHERGTEMTDSLMQNQRFTPLRKQTLSLVCGGALSKLLKEDVYNFSSPTAVKDDFKAYIRETNQLGWYLGRYARYLSNHTAEFAEIMTKIGVSYTFNMIESSKLLKNDKVSEDFAYSYEKEVNYPVYLPMQLRMADYMVIGYFSRKYEYFCTHASFAIHSPYEFPVDNDIVEVDAGKFYDIMIIPSIIKADEDIRQLSVSIRKCYFEDERELNFFKIYTQRNCEFECLSDVVHKKCGCVPFYYIRSNSWEVCEYRRMKFCVEKFLFERAIGNSSSMENCNCLPTCNSVSYSYELRDTSSTGLRIEEDFVLLMTRYYDSEFYALMRYEEFKLVDFLSYVGGILGLFAGISVLSFVEIAYFMTLRLITDVRRHFCS